MRVVVEIGLKDDQLGRHQSFVKQLEKLACDQGHKVTGVTFYPDHPVTLAGNSDLKELDLPKYIEGPLRQAGISSVGRLCSMTKIELLAVRGLGPKLVQLVVSCLQAHGLELNSEPS